MTIEEILKEHIIKQYKNINNFSVQSGIPYSTVANIFKRGIMGSSVSVVLNICRFLNIDTESLINGEIKERQIDNLSSDEKALVRAYRANPEMQTAVDKLLSLSPESKNNIGEDLASEIRATANSPINSK